VDDETKIRIALADALREDGHEVLATGSPREAQRLLSERLFDVLVVDNLMPELTGLDLIRDLAASTPPAERPQMIMMTAHATIESAIEAMKLGASDYLQKPFEIDELLVIVNRAMDLQKLSTEHVYLRTERDQEFGNYGIVGKSRRIEEIIKTIDLVAQSRSTVLVTGETGTGKELVARAIHHRSGQREMPLIKVNCAAIPETLLESELFGHVKGAFTGAISNKKGKFALADGGTIFLDEIGTMTTTLQSKLLRVLQEREFEPLGSERSQTVDVRVIAATNRDLRQMVSEAKFQEDLYYRLNVIPITLPPLRERRDDIPILIEHFVTLCQEARPAGGEADRKHRSRGPQGDAAVRLAWERTRAGECPRTRGRVDDDARHPGHGGVHAGSCRHRTTRVAVAQPGTEPRMGRARNGKEGARHGGRDQERRG
jgi:DNA-binding NtrC family response regulator